MTKAKQAGKTEPEHTGLLRHLRSPRIVRRFNKDREGTTAVEFAILAFPFFLLLFGIIECSLLFFAGQMLESAVDDVGRKIRTGQLDQTMTEDQLRFCTGFVFLSRPHPQKSRE